MIITTNEKPEPAGNVIEHLSASSINQFLKCPLQWKYRKIDNLVIPPGAALVKGSAVHLGLEYIYTEKKAFKTYYSDTAKDIAIEYIQDTETDNNTNKSQLKDSSVRLIDMYCNVGMPEKIKDENIQGVEHFISLKIGGIEVVGYIDLLEYDSITDFKTTGKTPSGIDLSKKIQAEIYSKATGISETKFQYLIDKKSPDVINLSHKAVNYETLQGLVVNVYKAMQNCIKSDDFPPSGLSSPWACNYCGYGEQGKCGYYKFNKK